MWSMSVIRRTVLSSAFRVSSSPRTCLLGGGFRSFTSKTSPDEEEQKKKEITLTEAKKLMRLEPGRYIVPYSALLEASQGMGLVRSPDEAHVFARVLDDAGVVLIFRDKVYLHPDKVVDLIRRVFPTDETPEEAQIKEEFNKMRTMKEEIDVLAHRQVRKILWFGLATAIVQISLFVRLTFWEFSWDVMEPITFFATVTSIILGYAYFLITSSDPTYQDLMKRLFLEAEERFQALERMHKATSSHAAASIRNRVGLELDLDDALQSRKD
ncbi:hypothetical protein Bca52824_075988 [Brassica carinata]|uniref:Calcium uniporter protein C-terminal domain-containing protein n=1 Tax=Brassica carinata TaxID=52824 RepID=A0A8X7TWV5_BRACI|nr:hypothetical protein Bca52824_075988 [Brassica carinata]